MNFLRCDDVFELNPNSRHFHYDNDQKRHIIHNALDDSAGTPSGLQINFQLSSSGRRINNRIYTPKGQRDGLSTWTQPYEAPVLTHHDQTHGEPIGRIKEVKWVSIKDEAIAALPGGARDYVLLKSAFDSNDPKKIYQAMKDTKTLTSNKWPGMGRLLSKAAIMDKAAIEKFLDGRYLTFSAGTYTDRYVCGICGSDWSKGGDSMCEHYPGEKTEDGDIGVFVTGAFNGIEASVVNRPADSQSLLISTQFIDHEEMNDRVDSKYRVSDASTVYMTDFEVGGELHVDAEQPPGALPIMTDMLSVLLGQFLMYYQFHWRTDGVPFYGDHLLFDRLYSSIQSEIDALAEKIIGYNGANAINMVELNRMATDKIAKWMSSGSDFRVIALASETDMQKVFRESYDSLKAMQNGMTLGLDDFIMATANSHDTHGYLLQQRTSSNPGGIMGSSAKDNQEGAPVPLEDGTNSVAESVKQSVEKREADDLVDRVVALVLEKIASASPAPVNEADLAPVQDAASEPVVEDNVDDLSGLNIDWATFEFALDAELGDAKLSSEKKGELADSAFCGPNRSFPISDYAHAVAARKLIERATLSDEQKTKILACVDRKAKSIDCGSTDQQANKRVCKCGNSQRDLEAALLIIEDLKAKLQNNNTTLEVNTTQDDTIVATPAAVKHIENPSVDSSDPSSSSASSKKTQEVDSFTQTILDRYNQLKNERGQQEANRYLYTKKAKGHLPLNFDINKVMES